MQDTTTEPIQVETTIDDDYSDFFSELTADRKFSADTVLNDETQLPEISPEAAPISSGNEKPKISEKDAWDNAETLMTLRETVQSYGLSWYCDGSFKNAEQYEYQPEEKRRLIKAWSKVVGHYNITISPWVDVIVTEAVCTGPLIALAYNNRQQRIELERQREELQRLRRENAELREEKTVSDTPTLRRDTKTAWKVDENGFFEYTEAGTYIPKARRVEKPPLTPDAYELLIKHNGKSHVDKVFNIND